MSLVLFEDLLTTVAWETVSQIAQKNSPKVIEEGPVVCMNFGAEKCMQSVIKSLLLIT